jgi:RNA polymerase sigma factor (sigma-70 family)
MDPLDTFNKISLKSISKYYSYDSEDILQDILLNIIERNTNVGNLKSYLITSLRRELSRRKNKKPTVELNEHIQIEDITCDGYEEDLIYEVVLKLPEKLKTVIILSKFENMKIKDIAKKENVSLKTIESRITKACKIIKNNILNE